MTDTNSRTTMKEFETYLRGKGFTDGGVRLYSRKINSFLGANPDADNFGYKDIILCLDQLEQRNATRSMKAMWLSPIKRYYDFLVETSRRDDHPCRTLNIKGPSKKGVIHSDLFSSAELELLMNREETFQHLKIKNQVLISFLIYQALLPSEISALKIQHVNLDEGTVYVKGGGRINMTRTLELHKRQMLLIDKYLGEPRKRLLRVRKDNTPTDALLLNYIGTSVKVDDVQSVIERMRLMFPAKKLNPKSIRDSVLSNMLSEKNIPLEQVQLFAGHRWISSTAKYRKKDLKKQQEILRKFHPMG